MLDVIKTRWRQGYRTMRWPKGPAPALPERFAGRPVISWKTADGYALRVAIPRAELGSTGTRLGFNVLIYDGDKADAAPGENINRSRLAWAPRSGVQGRPEDWGRLELP